MAANSERKIQGELARALSHPVRVEILESLRGRVASSGELSREMRRSQGVIAYHASALVRCGCVEVVETRSRQGTVECFFGLTPRSQLARESWRQAPASSREAVRGHALRGFAAAARRLLGDLRARNRRLHRTG